MCCPAVAANKEEILEMTHGAEKIISSSEAYVYHERHRLYFTDLGTGPLLEMI